MIGHTSLADDDARLKEANTSLGINLDGKSKTWSPSVGVASILGPHKTPHSPKRHNMRSRQALVARPGDIWNGRLDGDKEEARGNHGVVKPSLFLVLMPFL